MQIYKNGTLISSDQALAYFNRLAENQGLDAEEIQDLWVRALTAGEDGEYARDDLSAITDQIEILI